MQQGRFITFEGGEGTGKSTQARLLGDALRRLNQTVVVTREPGGAPGAELLRNDLLHAPIDWSPLAETLLHFAARAEHVAKTIRPALDAGHWVVCDRFHDSTRAYQGAGQAADQKVIEQLIDIIALRPALTLVLTARPGVRQARLAARGERADHYERQPPAFHERVTNAFHDIAQAEPARCVLVPGEGSVETVHQAVMKIVHARLGLPAA